MLSVCLCQDSCTKTDFPPYSNSTKLRHCHPMKVPHGALGNPPKKDKGDMETMIFKVYSEDRQRQYKYSSTTITSSLTLTRRKPQRRVTLLTLNL